MASKAKFDSAQHDLTLAQRRESEIRQELAGIRARLGGDPALPTDQNPDVLRAAAAIDQAKLDLEHTIVRAPEDAIIAAVSLQPGEIVELGQPLISMIGQSGMWITANFKETDLTHVRVGQNYAGCLSRPRMGRRGWEHQPGDRIGIRPYSPTECIGQLGESGSARAGTPLP